MTDAQDLKLVTIWGAAGLIASAVWLAVLSPEPASASRESLVERGIHNLDQQVCRRVLRGLAEESRADNRILWLWAEESTPASFNAVSWTKRVEPTGPPRPYAFKPDVQDVPAQACAFARNSVHVVSFAPHTQSDAWGISSRIE